MIAWLKEEWRPILVVGGIAAIGGLIGALGPTLWFMHGVCL